MRDTEISIVERITLFRSKKIWMLGLVVIVLVGGFFYYKKQTTYVAYVNGERMLASPVNSQIDNLKNKDPRRFEGPQGKAEEKKIRKMLLDQLILVKLIGQAAREAGVAVSEAEIDNEIQRQAEVFKGETSFYELMAASGYSGSILRDRLRDQLAAEKMKTKLARAVRASDLEVSGYIQNYQNTFESPTKQVRLAVITTENPSEVKTIERDLKNGVSFDVLAKNNESKYQPNPTWQLREFLNPKLALALKGLETGSYTRAFPNPDGSISWYELKEQKTRMSDKGEIREQVRAKLVQEKQANSFKVWLNEIKKQAKIDATI